MPCTYSVQHKMNSFRPGSLDAHQGWQYACDIGPESTRPSPKCALAHRGTAPGHDEAAAASADGERMLAEALAAEASQTAKRNKDPFADLGVKFVEARCPC